MSALFISHLPSPAFYFHFSSSPIHSQWSLSICHHGLYCSVMVIHPSGKLLHLASSAVCSSQKRQLFSVYCPKFWVLSKLVTQNSLNETETHRSRLGLSLIDNQQLENLVRINSDFSDWEGKLWQLHMLGSPAGWRCLDKLLRDSAVKWMNEFVANSLRLGDTCVFVFHS